VLLQKMFNLKDDEPIFLAEESMADLITLPVTSEIIQSGLEFEEALIIEEKSTEDQPLLGLALKLTSPVDFWLLLTDRYSDIEILRTATHKLTSEQIDISFKEITEREFFQALVEYFSISLKEELFCQECPIMSPPLHLPDRIERLKEFLSAHLPQNSKVLEVCCGNGMATQSLNRLKCETWTEDADNCEICQALKHGHLDPQKSMVLDARLMKCFFPPKWFDAVVGFMVGLIDDVNWPLWKDILQESSKLARCGLIYTTYTEREAKLVADAMEELGWNGKIIDNRDNLGIYDQWAYVAEKPTRQKG